MGFNYARQFVNEHLEPLEKQAACVIGFEHNENRKTLLGCKMSEFIKRVFSLRIRRRRRYRAKSGAYVILSAHPGKYQIDDIGFGGLSFHYIDNGYRPKRGSFDLRVTAEDQPSTIQLVGRTVHECETGELIFQKEKIKRRSIRFESLSRKQKKDLKAFIKNNRA